MESVDMAFPDNPVLATDSDYNPARSIEGGVAWFYNFSKIMKNNRPHSQSG